MVARKSTQNAALAHHELSLDEDEQRVDQEINRLVRKLVRKGALPLATESRRTADLHARAAHKRLAMTLTR
jgi:hypothetical protein